MKILVTGGSGFIGTNLMNKLMTIQDIELVNLDVVEPNLHSHLRYWKKTDLLDATQVQQQFAAFEPEAVLHLAARTDTDEQNTLEDYKLNTTGSRHIIGAIKATASVKRAIFTSTQFVNQYHGVPKHDEDYAPHTVYGESKVLMEKMIRSADLKCIWTIIRPTNIWGPWHLRYPFEFWKVLAQGLYVHPGRQPVIRSYGYVGNVCFQITSILQAQTHKVDKQVFYLGDQPIDLYDWVNGFSVAQTGKKVRVVPRWLVRLLAKIGDVAVLMKMRFPITSSRYKSMTNSNNAPMDKTLTIFGTPPYTLNEGIDETIEWMKKYHPALIKKH
jgi:nucleoside-diphosphate-sugar epimerase